jgi:hypothetical protein
MTSATPLMHARAHSAQYTKRILHHGGHSGGGGSNPPGWRWLRSFGFDSHTARLWELLRDVLALSSTVGMPACKHGRDSVEDAFSVNGNKYIYSR